MLKRFIISSGLGIARTRVKANSATAAMDVVLRLMRHRRLHMSIEDDSGNAVSFFQLRDETAAEKENAERA
jgi:hypothetical protein